MVALRSPNRRYQRPHRRRRRQVVGVRRRTSLLIGHSLDPAQTVVIVVQNPVIVAQLGGFEYEIILHPYNVLCHSLIFISYHQR